VQTSFTSTAESTQTKNIAPNRHTSGTESKYVFVIDANKRYLE